MAVEVKTKSGVELAFNVYPVLPKVAIGQVAQLSGRDATIEGWFV